MLDLIIGFFGLVFGFMFKIYCFFKKAVKWMLVPFSWLWEKVRDFCDDHLLASGKLNRRFSAFAGFGPFLLFCVIAVFATIQVGPRFADGMTSDYWMDVLYSTTLGSFMEIAKNGMNTTPTTLVAVAFGGFLFSACYDTLRGAKRYVKIPCFVLYFVMAANLALMLTDVFEIAGNWLYTNGMALIDDTSGSLWDRFVRLLAALPLIYVLLLLCFMTFSEYLECAVFGFVGILLLRLLSWLLGMLLGELGATELAYTITEQVALWAVVFGLEAIRKPLLEMLEDNL